MAKTPGNSRGDTIQILVYLLTHGPLGFQMMLLCLIVSAAISAPIRGDRFPSFLQIPPTVFRIHKQYFVVGGLRERLHQIEKLETRYSSVFVKFGDALAESSLARCNATDAFYKLVPGTFKSDLLRYCLVWLYGGFYMDIGALLLRPFEGVVDPKVSFVTAIDPGSDGYLSGFFGATPRHPILRTAIDMVIHNVNTCFRGTRSLAVTGPMLLKRAALRHPETKMHILNAVLNKKGHIKIDTLINNKYDGYVEDMTKSGYDRNGKEAYGYIWSIHKQYSHCTG